VLHLYTYDIFLETKLYLLLFKNTIFKRNKQYKGLAKKKIATLFKPTTICL
jgi:hypothetical protein